MVLELQGVTQEPERKDVPVCLQAKRNTDSDGGGAIVLHVGLESKDEEVTQARLDAFITAPCIADSGSYRTIVPYTVVEELLTLQPELYMRQLEQPVVASLADGTKVTSETSGCLDLQFITGAGVGDVSAVDCTNVNEPLARLAQTPILADTFDDFPVVENGDGDHTAIDSDLEEIIIGAMKDGIRDRELKRLHKLLTEFRNMWRDKLGPAPASKVAPLKVTLREGNRCHTRKYSPAQRRFGQTYTLEMPDQFAGITNDYSAVNKLTIPIACVMPNLDVALGQVSEPYGFAKIDPMKGFWWMQLHPDSLVIPWFTTEDSILTPLCVPQGARDSSVPFQNQLQDVFRDMIRHYCLIMIDDIVVYVSIPSAGGITWAQAQYWCHGVGSWSLEKLYVMTKDDYKSSLNVHHHRNCGAPIVRTRVELTAGIATRLREGCNTLNHQAGKTDQRGIDWTDTERAVFDEVCRLVAFSAPEHFPSEDSNIVVVSDFSHGLCTCVGSATPSSNIDRNDNLWANMISRCGQAGKQQNESMCRAVRTRNAQVTPTLSGHNLTTSNILNTATRWIYCELADDVVTINGRAWIPNKAPEQLTRLMVDAHRGSHGHRGEDPMLTLPCQRFEIDHLPSNVQYFLQYCLLYNHIKGAPSSATVEAHIHSRETQ
ncbi:hypothetical protein PHMEG_0003763 [Phytophthora megakarya]|uniref:Reverse transcriptase domain-containing protein n=1 Tax=Phytophthora megakarya TaxID=4795 RepID=A0A225WVN9_9STRA|nr:hypothetical protein PHMEG_0003763 [Phytophthora megakarya]